MNRQGIELLMARAISRPLGHHVAVFLFSGGADDLVCEIPTRTAMHMRERWSDPPSFKGFFHFEAGNGRSIAVNLEYVQAVRVQTGIGQIIQSSVRSWPPVMVVLRHRALIELTGMARIPLYDLMNDLEFGHWPTVVFDDREGRTWIFARSEIVWVSMSTTMLEEGARLAAVEDGLV